MSDVTAMLERNRKAGFGDKVDIEVLLAGRNSINWTASKYTREGDVLFFYCSKSARRNLASIPLHSRRGWSKRRALKLEEIYTGLEGTIFATGVASSSAIEPNALRRDHFLPGYSIVLAQSLPLRPVICPSRLVRIKRKGSVTSLTTNQTEELFRLASRRSALPNTFVAGDPILGYPRWSTFKKIAKEMLALDEEVQVLDFIAEPVAKLLRDGGTVILHEVNCFRDGRLTGTVDLAFRFCDSWRPLEVKIDILALSKKALQKQMAKYSGLSRLGSTIRRRYSVENDQIAPTPLLCDRHGLWAMQDGILLEIVRFQELVGFTKFEAKKLLMKSFRKVTIKHMK